MSVILEIHNSTVPRSDKCPNPSTSSISDPAGAIFEKKPHIGELLGTSCREAVYLKRHSILRVVCGGTETLLMQDINPWFDLVAPGADS